MSLKLWNPFSELIEQSFSDLSAYKPFTDVVESADQFKVTIDLPGLEKKNIELNITGDTLELSAELEKSSEKSDKWKIRHKERHRTKYHRKLVFPALLDAKNTSSELKDGVLTITLPKSPESKTVQLSIH